MLLRDSGAFRIVLLHGSSRLQDAPAQMLPEPARRDDTRRLGGGRIEGLCVLGRRAKWEEAIAHEVAREDTGQDRQTGAGGGLEKRGRL